MKNLDQDPDFLDLLAAWHENKILSPTRRKELLQRLQSDNELRIELAREIEMAGLTRAAQAGEPRWLELEEKLGISRSLPLPNFETEIMDKLSNSDSQDSSKITFFPKLAWIGIAAAVVLLFLNLQDQAPNESGVAQVMRLEGENLATQKNQLLQKGEEFTREIKSIDKSFLKHGDVTVKVEYSGLNYKDALILKNGARLVKEFPHIPGIDFSGKVEESNHKDFKTGDEVILTGWRVGEIYFGGYSQYAKVNGDFLVKKPKNLDLRQSMILGTAGLTALMCSFTTKATREELLLGDKVEDVIVSGASGGVGSMAVMMLNKLGCNVTAVTGKESNSEYLQTIGAKSVINTNELNKDARPLDKGLWDGAVDTVGGKVLENILAQTKDAGIVAACGNAADIKLNTTVMPFIIRGVKLWGINSVTASIKRRQFLWNEAGKLIDFEILEKSIKEIKLEEVIDVFPKMLKGETSGRYIINLNK